MSELSVPTQETSAKRNARIAVVIPSWGDEAHLERATRAIVREIPEGVACLVAHSGPADPTERLAALAPAVTVLHSPERWYAGAARNAGAAALEADWFAFVDSDVVVANGWWTTLLQAIEAAGPDEAIIGSLSAAEESDYWARVLWWIEFGSIQPSRPAHFMATGPSANMAVSAPLFERLGGFDETLFNGQDGDFFARLGEAGGRLAFIPGVAAAHVFVPGRAHALRRLATLGRFAARIRLAHPIIPGAAAARQPWLAPVLWPARIAQMGSRVLRARSGHRLDALGSFLWHLPGIAVGLAAWTASFMGEARRGKQRE